MGKLITLIGINKMGKKKKGAREAEEGTKPKRDHNLRRAKYSRHQFLLNAENKFSIQTGARRFLSVDKFPLDSFASFQVNRKLFVCGGFIRDDFYDTEYTSNFFAMDCEGRTQELSPLPHRRDAISLSGLTSVLVALGGGYDSPLGICDIYSIPSNNWKALPPLVTPRSAPGGCLLPSLRAYCFCGE